MREIRDEHSVETKRLKVGQIKASVHKNTVRLYLIEDTVRHWVSLILSLEDQLAKPQSFLVLSLERGIILLVYLYQQWPIINGVAFKGHWYLSDGRDSRLTLEYCILSTMSSLVRGMRPDSTGNISVVIRPLWSYCNNSMKSLSSGRSQSLSHTLWYIPTLCATNSSCSTDELASIWIQSIAANTVMQVQVIQSFWSVGRATQATLSNAVQHFVTQWK